jgi:hypothetical protein
MSYSFHIAGQIAGAARLRSHGGFSGKARIAGQKGGGSPNLLFFCAMERERANDGIRSIYFWSGSRWARRAYARAYFRQTLASQGCNSRASPVGR